MKKLLLFPIHILTGLFLFSVTLGSPFVLVFALVYFTSDKAHAIAACRLMAIMFAILWAGQYFYKIGKTFWEDES